MTAKHPSSIKTIIADDHELFADGLEQILTGTPGFEVIAKVDNGKMLMQTLNRLTPDLILLDIHMPFLDGLETAIHIKRKLPAIKIVFISMTYDPLYKTFMHEYDIDGFMNKNVSATLLKEMLQNVMAGRKIFIHANQTAQPPETILSSESEFLKMYKLTKTEVEIIQLIAQGFSTKAIAAKRELSAFTVESHRKNIFRKLKARNMAEVATFASQQKLLQQRFI